MPAPSLKFIKTFHIAARCGSFKLAADDLHVSASAVSNQIRTLEEQLGLSLFDRGAHSLTLTEAGNYYLQNVESLFARLDLVTEQLRARFRKLVVRLVVPPFFASELLLPKLSGFSEAHPDIDIHVNTRATPNSEHDANADVSIIVGNGNWPDAETSLLIPQRFVAACSPQYLREHPVTHAQDLASESLIVHTRRLDLWDRWATLCGIEALHPRQMIRLDSMAATVHAAEQGVGFVLVSTPLAFRRFECGTLQRVLDVELTTGEGYFLIARPEDAGRPAVRALIDWLQTEFGQPPR